MQRNIKRSTRGPLWAINNALPTHTNVISCKPEKATDVVTRHKKDVNGKQISFRVVPIDFGLSSASSGLTSQRLAEDKAVDLYVFERALTCGLDHKALLKAFPDHPVLNTPDGVMNLIMDAYRENYAVQPLNEESEQQQERLKCKSSVNKKSGGNLDAKRAEVKEVLSRLEEVRQRGRKRLMVG
ncbi:unnamed protein product [Trichobilharzia szidati]|nr:unnamed protein product [Trichobilharzia szidati]